MHPSSGVLPRAGNDISEFPVAAGAINISGRASRDAGAVAALSGMYVAEINDDGVAYIAHLLRKTPLSKAAQSAFLMLAAATTFGRRNRKCGAGEA